MREILHYLADIDLVGALSVGAIGLSFFVALFAAFLVSQRNTPRQSSFIFMCFALVLVALGIGSQHLERSYDKSLIDLGNTVILLEEENSRLKKMEVEAATKLHQMLEKFKNEQLAILQEIELARADTESCRSFSQGASQNTSTPTTNCTTPALEAESHGRSAIARLDTLRGMVMGLDSSQ